MPLLIFPTIFAGVGGGGPFGFRDHRSSRSAVALYAARNAHVVAGRARRIGGYSILCYRYEVDR